jgi:hypothetical protein
MLYSAKYWICFLCAIFLEFWFNLCAYSANHDNVIMGVISNITYPFIAMIPVILLIEEEGWKNKLKMGLAQGLGYGTGTAIWLTQIKGWVESI